MKIDFENITWELYCEYLGVPFFEPFKPKEKIILADKSEKIEGLKKEWEYLYALDYVLQTPEEDMEELEKRGWYVEYLEYTMDKSKFLNSEFHAYLINKNRTDLINKILENERKDG